MPAAPVCYQVAHSVRSVAGTLDGSIRTLIWRQVVVCVSNYVFAIVVAGAISVLDATWLAAVAGCRPIVLDLGDGIAEDCVCCFRISASALHNGGRRAKRRLCPPFCLRASIVGGCVSVCRCAGARQRDYEHGKMSCGIALPCTEAEL